MRLGAIKKWSDRDMRRLLVVSGCGSREGQAAGGVNSKKLSHIDTGSHIPRLERGF